MNDVPLMHGRIQVTYSVRCGRCGYWHWLKATTTHGANTEVRSLKWTKDVSRGFICPRCQTLDKNYWLKRGEWGVY